MSKVILKGWKEIEAFARVGRQTLKTWMKKYNCPIVPGSGRRQPIASCFALENFLIKMAEDKLYSSKHKTKPS